jgi:uncharacterized protein (TIGR00375 family)
MITLLVIADFHLHSRYSRATSKEMNLENLASYAKLKGINLLGTGDFTHPLWLRELKQKLVPVEGSGLFSYKETLFMLTAEVSTIYEQGGKLRRIHHLIHLPGFEEVDQLNSELSKRGNLAIDGRPILRRLTSPELVEMVHQTCKDAFVVPSHAWTPWYSLFGSASGFDSIQDCYQDQLKHIFAIETGLSSDPPMNWRLTQLDEFALLSSSDSHSPWNWRIGRETNVFELEKVTYWEIRSAIRERDPKRFLFTIEVDPSYGKYHYDGHRACSVSLEPREAMRRGNLCPRCGGKLTIGVLHRVEELADRDPGFTPSNATPFKKLLPLYEIISYVTGARKLYSREVIEEQERLIRAFGNELKVLLEVPEEELKGHTSERIAKAIVAVREGKVEVIPGYDGVYGEPVFFGEKRERKKFPIQKTLMDF